MEFSASGPEKSVQLSIAAGEHKGFQFFTQDRWQLLIGRWWLASHLLRRRSSGDEREAERLLCLALADARQMQLPEAAQIEAFLKSYGLSCD